MQNVIGVLISERTIRFLAVIMISGLSIGAVSYTVVQLRTVNRLQEENVRLIAEVSDLKERLAVSELRLDKRLIQVEQALAGKKEAPAPAAPATPKVPVPPTEKHK